MARLFKGFIIALLLSFCLCSSNKKLGLISLEEFVLGLSKSSIPPYYEDEDQVNVTISYYPAAILELDSAKEELAVSSFLELIWYDDDIFWDPEDYAGHHYLEVDPSDIWTPSLIISDSIIDGQPLTSKNKVIVDYHGYMVWQLTDVFRTRCKINVKDYPFDIQVCNVTFVPPYGYIIYLQREELHFSSLDVTPKNGEWTLLKTEFNLIPVVGIYDLYAAQFSLTIRREFVYHIINIIFPMGLLSILNPFVFLIPVNSGEKLGFLMAIFVSHAMFLNLIHQSMPPTSDALSTLAMFLALIEVQSFLTILATIVVLCVHHRNTIDKREQCQGRIDSEENLVEVKTGRKLCKLSLERFLNGLFFIISLGMALVGCTSMWVVSRTV